MVLNQRSTDIIVTMGPEADDRNKIIAMLHAGMDIARFELTNDNQKEVRRRMQNLKAVLEITNKMGPRGDSAELDTLQQCKILVDIADPTESCTLANA